ncbi:MAG: DEAD/DEAH box helicase family protein [Candidatus Auribacterota bacterium]|nr:DEAD/DEAH box helicase family protein [Candidatus Auribacterota bacterium]
MNEAEVRKELDRMLGMRNWHVDNPAEVGIEFEMERRWGGNIAGPTAELYPTREFADYLLYGRDRKPLAIIEAKRTSKNPKSGKTQADGYAENIKAEYDVDPFIFLSNGEDIWFWDRLRYPPRIVRGFFERDDLERLAYQRRSRRPLSALRINPDIADRDYQAEAIKRVCGGLEEGFRKFLLVMATGTGKTRTAMALIDVLIRSRWINTVLFLTDRKMLRDQSYGQRGFQGFFTEACGKVKSGNFDKTKRLYAATIQTMMECYRDISPGFFDLVISDECHRSIYNKWKDVLTYFDAIQIGLTATPSDWMDRDTFRFFDCRDGAPTFNYDYRTAVDEKWLVPFIPYHAKTSFQIKGIREDEIPPAVKKKLVEEGRTLDELNFEGTEFEKRFTNTGTHEAMVREFMEVCRKDESGVLPGKTIIFAMTKNHAYRLQETFDRLYPSYKGRLAEVITCDDSRVDTFLPRFENNRFPLVAISVDMLDTGVDIREVVNLVFAKPVFSKIKFWQMIGRGTRTLEPTDIKDWCREKKNFLVIDHWVLKESIKEDLKLLPMTLRVVKAHEAAVYRASSDAFWDTIDRESVGFMKRELVPIMRYRRKAERRLVELDLDDAIIERRWIEFGPGGEGEYVHIYREKVEQRIYELAEKDPTIIKLKKDEPISIEDIGRLEETLNSPELYINEENLRDAYRQPEGTFAQFIKMILGTFEFPTAEEKIAESFDAFIVRKNYFNADQTRFLRVVKSVFLEKARRREALALADLYEAPFDTFGEEAADRLFEKEELKEIVKFFNQLPVA